MFMACNITSVFWLDQTLCNMPDLLLLKWSFANEEACRYILLWASCHAHEKSSELHYVVFSFFHVF